MKLPSRTDNYAALSLGTGTTICCGAYATFHDSTLCCKVCWDEVGLDRPTPKEALR